MGKYATPFESWYAYGCEARPDHIFYLYLRAEQKKIEEETKELERLEAEKKKKAEDEKEKKAKLAQVGV